MAAGSVFSGIGGLDLAVESALGERPAWFCESDPKARKVLAKHWPGIPIHTDVRQLDDAQPVEMLHGGYPCQPFSANGRKLGGSDERDMWPEMAHAIRLLRPRRVLLENVANHLGLGFARTISDLSSLGYDTRWGVVRASDAGAPHKRARLFAVADTVGQRQHGRIPRTHPGGRTGITGHRCDPQGWGSHKRAIERWENITGIAAPEPANPRGRLMPEFVEWMMGLPIGWTEGHPRGHRLRMLGNSVCPQQGDLAIRLILDKEATRMTDTWRNHYDRWKLASPPEPILDEDGEPIDQDELDARAEDAAIERAERAREDRLFDLDDRDDWR